MNRRIFLTLMLIVACITFSAAAANGATINVFAAASLTDSLKEIGTAYEKETGDKVVFNFGASSLLARQIEEAAPADIFFSADEAKMDALETKGLLFSDTRKKLLANSLVIVVANDSSLEISAAADLKKVKRLALAETRTVPAGIYAKEYLTAEGLWDDVKSKVVPMDNVRAALAAVESGNVDASIVYKTDAAISKKVKVVYRVPAAKTPNISYPVAVVKESKNPAAARRFVEHLSAASSQKVFESFGFIIQK